MRVTSRIGAAAAAMLLPFAAFAAEPRDWQLGFQRPATPVMERLDGLHDELLVITTLICLFVLGLLGYVIVKFNAKAHPTPTRTTHNTVIEVLWTVVPVVILVIIAIPSFRLLYFMDRTQDAEMTIKVVGHQWYWSYEYPDHGGFSFDSNMIPEAETKPDQKRLLDVDNRLVVPVGTNIRLLVTGADVMHSFYVPSFGVQTYTIAGRLNETWMNVKEAGVYYGQCNQICGVNHPYMPIAIEAVAKEQFAKWAEEAKTKFARLPAPASGPLLADATLSPR